MERFELRSVDIIRQMRIPGHPTWFALGIFDSRVTMYSQQIRAVNLAYALLHTKLIRKGMDVAVIGAGVAGLTFAAAATRHKCRVSVFEKAERAVSIQAGNHTRWVHPNIYNWPRPGSERPSTDLPLMNWKAGIACEVAESITDEWESVKPKRSRVRLGLAGVDVSPLPVGGRTFVRWRSSDPEQSGDGQFDVVVFAVGFGIEPQRYSLGQASYWRDDDLHQADLGGLTRSILVSGTGDGGLVDVLRASLNGFSHDRVLVDFIVGDVGPLKSRLLDIEHNCHIHPIPELWMYEQYKKLSHPPTAAALKARLRKNVTVTLNGMHPWPFSLNSSILHRFLVSQLLKCGVHYIEGNIEDVRNPVPPHEVEFSSHKPVTFDRVILRHGPAPAFAASFSNVAKKCGSLRIRSEQDQSRFPIWDKDFCKLQGAQ